MDSWFVPFVFPATFVLNCRGNALHLIQDRLSDAEFCENRANLSSQFAPMANGRFQFYKRCQRFIRTHNEALSVGSMSTAGARIADSTSKNSMSFSSDRTMIRRLWLLWKRRP